MKAQKTRSPESPVQSKCNYSHAEFKGTHPQCHPLQQKQGPNKALLRHHGRLHNPLKKASYLNFLGKKGMALRHWITRKKLHDYSYTKLSPSKKLINTSIHRTVVGFLRECVQGEGGNWGNFKDSGREDWGTLVKMRGITTSPLKNPIALGFNQNHQDELMETMQKTFEISSRIGRKKIRSSF